MQAVLQFIFVTPVATPAVAAKHTVLIVLTAKNIVDDCHYCIKKSSVLIAKNLGAY